MNSSSGRAAPSAIQSIAHGIMPLLVGIVSLGMGSSLLFTLIGIRLTSQGVAAWVTGALGSAYFAGFLVGAFLARGAIKRLGHVRGFIAFTALSSIATAAHALVNALCIWGALRVLMGLCLAGTFVVSESWVQFKTTNATRGRTFALYAIAASGGFAIGPLLVNLADPMTDDLFVLASMLFLAAFLPLALSRMSEPAMDEIRRASLRDLLHTVPIAVIGVFAAGLILSSFAALGPVFANQIGMSAGMTSVFVAAMSFGGIIMQYPIGVLSDRLNRQLLIIILGVGSVLASVVAMKIGNASIPLLVGLSFLHGSACQPVYGVSVALANDVMGPQRFVATSASLLLVNGIGTSLGPTAASLAIDLTGPRGLFLFFAVVLGGLSFLAAMAHLFGWGQLSTQDKFVNVPLNVCSCSAPTLDPRVARSQKIFP